MGVVRMRVLFEGGSFLKKCGAYIQCFFLLLDVSHVMASNFKSDISTKKELQACEIMLVRINSQTFPKVAKGLIIQSVIH